MNNNFNKPNFLIIGAQKSGTTSLYMDLSTSADIYFPIDKEPGHLACENIYEKDVVNSYYNLFKSGNNKLCGEASTVYTKRPFYDGVAERAEFILGSDTVSYTHLTLPTIYSV